MESGELGPHNAIWDDGEWIGWDWINSQLAEAEMRDRFPDVDLAMVEAFDELLDIASRYNGLTGRHLQVYGDLGELFGAVKFGIRLHETMYAQGSDGKLGDDFVEIKTITPFKSQDSVCVNLSGNFSKLLVVKIDEDFRVEGRMIDRKALETAGRTNLVIRWDDLAGTGSAQRWDGDEAP